ncbi:MAG TPA: hypothetical protein VFN90_00630 [Gemmatimonadales bacterium]|nr:hypothetical protein [Gemmatimonadales bacterium]
MYSTCLHCTKSLGTNQVLETLPIGRRVAFDADKGRLWVVCPECARWNLVPFDTRLESIDACERLYRDTPTRYATDNIGLARTKEGLELVRIGEPLRPEFASWRYGEQYKRRRRKAQLIGGVAAGAVIAGFMGLGAAGMSIGGFSWLMIRTAENMSRRALDKRRRLAVAHPDTEAPLQLQPWSARHAALVWDGTDVPTLALPTRGPEDRLVVPVRWSGEAIPTLGRRVMASNNLTDGSSRQLREATELLATERGDLSRWTRERVKGQRRFLGSERWEFLPHEEKPDADNGYWNSLGGDSLILGRLLPYERLAIEMWLSEDVERTWLHGELKLLEREWREAERLGKIADDLMLP